MSQLTNRAGTIREWIRRRREKGIEPNADAIWNHIQKVWPTIHDNDAEFIFQNCEPRP